jgi:ATP-dependent Lon protease
MEILQLSGYTEDEKLGIASKFLLPRQLKGHGLKATDVVIDEVTLRWLIRSYTREAGVRKLEQHVASLCRKAVRRNLQFREALPITLTPERIRELLGPPRYRDPHNDRREEVGVAVGLAWTEVGGELLPAEVVVLPGKGGLMLTGKLGEVMQESAKAALSWIRAHAHDYGIATDFHKHTDIHVHFPEGAVPKDGPSAGITTVAALVSALSRRALRQDVAMTGEINLRGQVMRIGGLKEKVLAAHREGITTVIIPSDNLDDLEDIPQNIRQAMVIQPVATIADALKVLLLPARPGASATSPGAEAPEAPAPPEKPRRRRAPLKPMKSPPAPAAKAPRAKPRSPRP